MKITSSAFEHEGPIPTKYTCDGDNISPPLVFSDIPDNTRSLVLIMDDPDAIGGNFNHWTVWNISPKNREFSEGSVPSEAVQGWTSYATPGYGGPCPPNGRHRYFFRLYAIDAILSRLGSHSSRTEVNLAMDGHIIDHAELMGTYDRVG